MSSVTSSDQDARPIPDERDQISSQPERPDLRCEEHAGVCELLHSLHGRLMELEFRVRALEG